MYSAICKYGACMYQMPHTVYLNLLCHRGPLLSKIAKNASVIHCIAVGEHAHDNLFGLSPTNIILLPAIEPKGTEVKSHSQDREVTNS